MAKKKKAGFMESWQGLRERLMARHAKRVKEGTMEESGSNEIRGKNQDAQLRAMWHKDPHGHPDED